MFGLLPAIRMSRTDISGSLKDSGRAISGPRTRMQSALVMGEMAMALVGGEQAAMGQSGFMRPVVANRLAPADAQA